MEDIKKYLSEKGWKKSDINKTLRIIEHAKKNKHPQIKVLDKLVYWFSLLIAIIGNLLISVSLIPLLLIFRGPELYFITVILGFSFGLLFELLVRTIEHLKTHHHIFLGIIIPILAVINFTIILNSMQELTGITIQQNPIIIGSVYTIAFMLPYISYQLFLKDR